MTHSTNYMFQFVMTSEGVSGNIRNMLNIFRCVCFILTAILSAFKFIDTINNVNRIIGSKIIL